jgi:hypothetical protein
VNKVRVASGIGGIILTSAGLFPLFLGIRALPDSIRMIERAGSSAPLLVVPLAYSVLLAGAGAAVVTVGVLVLFTTLRGGFDAAIETPSTPAPNTCVDTWRRARRLRATFGETSFRGDLQATRTKPDVEHAGP